MNTTHLFVELLVIGFGALAWLLLIVAAVLGYDITSVQSNLLSLGTLFPILSFGYVLGILVDRIADWSFDWLWGERHFRQVYLTDNEDRASLLQAAELPDDLSSLDADERARLATLFKRLKKDFFDDRRILVVGGAELWQFVEYGRSRLRICRGWVVNALLLAFAFDIYWYFGGAQSLPIDGLRVFYLNVVLLLFAAICFFAWSRLNQQEYSKIRRQAAWIRRRLEETAVQDVALSGQLKIEGKI